MKDFGLLGVTAAAATRLRRHLRGDRGQGSIEYVGITILVVAIVVLLLNTNMGTEIANTFTQKINSVLNSGGGGGGGGG
jgi:Flp pilus assembly pilin Flp